MEYKGRKSNGFAISQKQIKVKINYRDRVEFSSAVAIDKAANFSNFIIQLCCAIRFCEENGIEALYLKDDSKTRQLTINVKKFHAISRTKIEFRITNEDPSAFLTFNGMFFYREFLKNKQIIIPEGISYIATHTELHESSNNLCRDNDKDIEDLDSELIIHIRSGDIFESQNPHPGYGQPPLSFYKKCILDFSPTSITLVYQNLSNPIIEPLQEWLNIKSIKYRNQSSPDLIQDVQALLGGNSFIIRKGTFKRGVLGLKTNVNKVYVFGKNERNKLHKIVPTIKSIIEYSDSDNIYTEKILSNNWKNTTEQRELMLRYSEKDLTISS